MFGLISVQVILSEGGVPQRPVVFVTRPVLLDLLRKKLRQLQKAPGWVTVFGMAGSGKSVIASEAVRDRVLIKGIICPDKLPVLCLQISSIFAISSGTGCIAMSSILAILHPDNPYCRV